jgi:hypothetical protein
MPKLLDLCALPLAIDVNGDSHSPATSGLFYDFPLPRVECGFRLLDVRLEPADSGISSGEIIAGCRAGIAFFEP